MTWPESARLPGCERGKQGPQLAVEGRRALRCEVHRRYEAGESQGAEREKPRGENPSRDETIREADERPTRDRREPETRARDESPRRKPETRGRERRSAAASSGGRRGSRVGSVQKPDEWEFELGGRSKGAPRRSGGAGGWERARSRTAEPEGPSCLAELIGRVRRCRAASERENRQGHRDVQRRTLDRAGAGREEGRTCRGTPPARRTRHPVARDERVTSRIRSQSDPRTSSGQKRWREHPRMSPARRYLADKGQHQAKAASCPRIRRARIETPRPSEPTRRAGRATTVRNRR